MKQVLFVCLGNICRSPMAEGVFRKLVDELGATGRFRADSAGTGDWHIGEPPDPRAIAAAQRRQIDIADLRARQVAPTDFDAFDLILAMDAKNLADLRRLGPPVSTRIELFMSFAPGAAAVDVPDPYLAVCRTESCDECRRGV